VRAKDLACLAAFLCLALSGCTPYKAAMLMTEPRPVGSFTLGAGSRTVQDLLLKLRERAPQKMGAAGFEDAVFLADESRQWAVVRFKSASFLKWEFGIQFFRGPDETGNRVQALVRTASLNEGEPDEARLEPVRSALQRALESAFAGH